MVEVGGGALEVEMWSESGREVAGKWSEKQS